MKVHGPGWAKLALLLAGTLCGLALVEGLLRIVKPELRDIVDAKFEKHAYRIHSNPRNSAYTFTQPDTGEDHAVIHNSLGLRQHRDFEVAKARGTLRIGFFGDSFTENRRIPAQYSFSEPLDFLLNEAGVDAEVLNFGTDSYGTDQAYLQYRDDSPGLGLDYVFYVYCHNDLRDILADRLYEVSPAGELRYLPQRKTARWVERARNFYLTYFVLGELSRFSWHVRVLGRSYDPDTVIHYGHEQQNRGRLRGLRIMHRSPQLERSLTLFRLLVSRFKAEAESRDQQFVVVLLPRHKRANLKIAAVLDELGIASLDLFPLFDAEEQALELAFFENDPHWNEEGNKLAAVHLFKYLAGRLGIEADDELIQKALYRYYHSFEPERVTGHWLSPTKLIHDDAYPKYLALEILWNQKEE